MNRYRLVLFALASVGCSPDDPATSRLKPGQIVVLTAKRSTANVVFYEPGRGIPLMTGDTATVVTDESPTKTDRRPVTVKIATSAESTAERSLVGSVCTIERDELRVTRQQE